MKVTIKAGAEIDTLTRGELAAELAAAGTAWRHELSRGVAHRTATMIGVVTAGGTLTLGETGDQVIGPTAGMFWSCRRITVGDGYTPASQRLSLYRDSVSPSTLIVPDLTGYDELYGEPLRSGERLVVDGASLTASAAIWVTVYALEAPEYLSWRL